jgi:GcrA cell cycle regulator
MLWTEEAIEVLKQLALEGRSARAIAEALGAPSRAAVIGKASRVGIKLNGGVGGAAPRRARGDADRPRPAVIPRPNSLSCRPALVPDIPREPRKPRWIFARAEVGEMQRVGFAEMGEVNCRWPLGDPLSEDFAYCGLQPAPGRSYCAGHCRMAYQPPKAGRSEECREERWSSERASLGRSSADPTRSVFDERRGS